MERVINNKELYRIKFRAGYYRDIFCTKEHAEREAKWEISQMPFATWANAGYTIENVKGKIV